MGRSSQPPRTPSTLSDPLHQRLNMYALAASAAGVGALALAQPCQAKIIYTKTHQVIGTNGFYGLDLNHDANIDFLIQERGSTFSSTGSNGLFVKEAFGNAVRGSNFLALALSRGAPIGPRQQFISRTNSVGELMFNVVCTPDTGCSTQGQWGGVSDRYLGLRFQISGKTHYGWARLSVDIKPGHNIVATLTGYAYQTIANKKISAGQTSSRADHTAGGSASAESEISDSAVVQPSPLQQPSSLGRLALGMRDVPLRRQP